MINECMHFNSFWPLVSFLSGGFLLLIFIELIFKTVALWKAARADQMGWFIALIVFNTVGILPIIYLLFFAKKTAIKSAPKSNKRLKR